MLDVKIHKKTCICIYAGHTLPLQGFMLQPDAVSEHFEMHKPNRSNFTSHVRMTEAQLYYRKTTVHLLIAAVQEKIIQALLSNVFLENPNLPIKYQRGKE